MQLELVPLATPHLPTVFSWRSEAASVRFNPLEQISYEDAVKKFKEQTHKLSDPGITNYRLVALLNGEVAGNINLNGINHMMHYAELGYTVGEKFQGKGVATEMIRQLINRAFTETKLRKLFAHVHEENAASRRVLEKLGFHKEGLLREHYLIQGKPVNEIFYGLLKSDWPPNP